MPKVTSAQLLERLRGIYSENGEPLTDERLARRLDMNMSTFNRWKKGSSRQFEQIVDMLELSGWISYGEDESVLAASSRDPLATLATTVVEIGETQKDILARLDALDATRATQESTARAAPKRTVKR